ncbi:hypothetical protein GCM10009429_44100 [Dyella marensis]
MVAAEAVADGVLALQRQPQAALGVDALLALLVGLAAEVVHGAFLAIGGSTVGACAPCPGHRASPRRTVGSRHGRKAGSSDIV